MTELQQRQAPTRAAGAATRSAYHPPPPRRRFRRGFGLGGLITLLPLLLVFGYFGWWPIGQSVMLSLQQTNLVDPPTWVGVDNFRYLFADPLLWTTLRNTAWFVVLALIFGFPVPVLLALFVSELRRLGACSASWCTFRSSSLR